MEDYASKIAKLKTVMAAKEAEMFSRHHTYMKDLADRDQRMKDGIKKLEASLQENEDYRCKELRDFKQQYLVSLRRELLPCRSSF